MSAAVDSFSDMSYGLMTYVVDLDVLNGSVGSKDVKTRRMIGGRFKQRLAHFDGQFDHLADEHLPIYEAIRAVIDGGPFDEKHSVTYNYAFKWICEFHGRFLDNSNFSPMKAGWTETVDEGLAELGVTAVMVEDLCMGSAPSPIPMSSEGFPCYGEWSLAECEKALAQWEEVTEERKAAIDPYVLKAAESCMGWCGIAIAAERGVAGFFY